MQSNVVDCVLRRSALPVRMTNWSLIAPTAVVPLVRSVPTAVVSTAEVVELVGIAEVERPVVAAEPAVLLELQNSVLLVGGKAVMVHRLEIAAIQYSVYLCVLNLPKAIIILP